MERTFFTQADRNGRRLVMHHFNRLNTTANYGLPAMDVPLREETVPVHGIRVRFEKEAPARFHVEPGGVVPQVSHDGMVTVVDLPLLEVHALLMGES